MRSWVHTPAFPVFVSGSASGGVLISSIVEKRPKDHTGLFFQTVTFKY